MHCKVDVCALHVGKGDLQCLPSLRHRIAQDVAGGSIAVHGEDEFVDRISQQRVRKVTSVKTRRRK
jgi:hypothetical protein